MTFSWFEPTGEQWAGFAIAILVAGGCGYYVALATRRIIDRRDR